MVFMSLILVSEMNLYLMDNHVDFFFVGGGGGNKYWSLNINNAGAATFISVSRVQESV